MTDRNVIGSQLQENDTMREPGQPNAATLELCFWEALKRCAMDEDVPINLELRSDGDTGSGIELPNPIPPKLWEYMAAAHAELRTV